MKLVGAVPIHIESLLLMKLFEIGKLIVISIAELLSATHTPDFTTLLYHVFCDNIPGI